MINLSELQATLERAFPGSTVHVQDLTGGGDHFQALIVSPSFEGKGLVEQHQMVYGALKDAMGNEGIHALALRTYTPREWEKLGT
jgi:stress-induced morphogen